VFSEQVLTALTALRRRRAEAAVPAWVPHHVRLVWEFGPLSDTAVVDLLWRDGKVPLWIDVTVVARAPRPRIELCCAGVRTAADYYYREADAWSPLGRPPFVITSIGEGEP
jgi:hypothetical protein